jgi:hypothetical protein
VSRTTIEKKSVGYWPAQSPRQVRGGLSQLLEWSHRDHTNLIIRPHIRSPAGLIQLDDLPVDVWNRVRHLAFLVISTSADKRQAWIATEGCDWNFHKRVVHAAGCDSSANGWVRIAGSPNVKPQYSPNFPTVRIEATASRPKVGPEEFRGLGLVTPEQTSGRLYMSWPVNGKTPTRFPYYQISLNGAPLAPTGEKSHSHADFTWCCTAFKWGWSPAEITAQLLKEPLSKAVRILKSRHPAARQKAEEYAELTVYNAFKELFGPEEAERVFGKKRISRTHPVSA